MSAVKAARAAALALAVAAGSFTPRLMHAANDDLVWFWEDEHSYGWADTIDVRHGNPPPQHFDHKLSLTEQCALKVGRLLQRDRSGRVYSTQLEDACVRDGGRL